MEKLKNYGIGFLAVVGLLSLLTQATTEPNYGTPPSHVWEIHSNQYNGAGNEQVYVLNKVTGEVRKYGELQSEYDYVTMKEKTK